MKLAHRIAGVLFAALLLSACDTRESHHVPRSTEPYQRWEAPGVYGATTGARNIYWMDNERVLYVGREEGETHERSTLRIWTPATGKVEVVGPAQGELCYFRGYVQYVDSIKGAVYSMKEGKLGSNLDTVPDSSARHKDLYAKGFRVHPITCRYYQSKDLGSGENCKIPLLEGDGYLEVGGGRCEETNRERLSKLDRLASSDEAARNELERFRTELARRPVKHVSSSGVIVALPIEANEFMSDGPRYQYVEWKGQYLLPQSRAKKQPTHGGGVWPKDQEYLVYLLAPPGQVETLAIPIQNNFSRVPNRVAVTRAGPVLMSPGTTLDGQQNVWGVVLYTDRIPALLDDGVTNDLALSPDGCRLAYIRQTGEATRASPVVTRVRAIDLCNRSR